MKAIASGVHLLRRHDQVAFVLAIGVVDDDHHASRADVLDGLRDRRERRSSRARLLTARSSSSSFLSDLEAVSSAMRRSTYFAITSTSRFTGSPGTAVPSVVTASVCGISATAHPVAGDLGDREADAVHRDRALLHHVAEQPFGHADA